jgi:hypothetical protein
MPLKLNDYCCPYDGSDLQDTEVTLYPDEKPHPGFGCPKCHRILFAYELCIKTDWPKRHTFLKSRAGKMSPIGSGER